MKVLVADDDRVVRHLLTKLVQRWGYEAVPAEDGKLAWSALREENGPRIAILDWQMPGMDGIEICRRIKRDPSLPFAYILMLTSRDAKQDMVAGLNAGADDYLVKPADPAILESRLKVARRIVEAVPPREWARPAVPGYTVERLIGRGAAGTVWEAVHQETGRQVALKVLRLDLVSADVLQRFGREIQITEGFDHPNVVKVYESRITDSLCCYAMELVKGVHLSEYVTAHQLTIPKFLHLMVKVCDAVAHAHQQGVVHRDLKPQNILVSDAGEPKVGDFGVAKTMLRGGPGGANMQTLQHTAVGTPMFMAPEQARCEHDKVDPRTDVYALGVILYIMLAGRHPHELNVSSTWEIMRSIADGQVRPLRHVARNVDPALEAIVMKALAHEPDERPPCAGALRDELKHYLLAFLPNRQARQNHDRHPDEN